MTVENSKKTSRLSGFVSVEEADQLLVWLCNHPNGSVDLSEATHIHAAVLQVLMATRPGVEAWPRDAEFSLWLQRALAQKKI